MRNIIIIITLAFIIPSLNGQDIRIYSEENILKNFPSEETEALIYLNNLKEKIEIIEEWDENLKYDYVTILNYLIDITSRNGLFVEEENILSSAMHQFNSREDLPNNPYSRYLRVCMTRLLKDLGDMGSLLNYGHQALMMYEEAQDYSFDYIILLNNISNGYYFNNDCLSAKLYIDEAIEQLDVLINNNQAVKDGLYYFLINTRGMIETELGLYHDAICDFEEIINNVKKEDPSSPYNLAVNNLANVYTRLQEYEKARELLNNIDNSSLELSLIKNQNLSVLSYLLNDSLGIIGNLKDYNNEQLNLLLNIITNFSETERESYLKKYGRELVYLNNMIGYKFPKLTEESFNNNLLGQEIGLTLSKIIKNILENNNNINIETSQINEQLNNLKKEVHKKEINYQQKDSLHREIIELENLLLRSNPEIKNIIIKNIGDWKNIKGKLEPGEVLIDFCYLPEAVDFNTSTNYIGAYCTIPTDTLPTLIKLCELDTLESIFYNVNPNIEFITELYSQKKSNQLYKLLWEPLELLIKNAKKVYYTTNGSLNLINHDALSNNDGNYLGFNKNLILLSSPSNLLEKEENPNQDIISEIILLGDPTFNILHTNINTQKESSKEISKDNIILAIRGELMRDGWNPLPGSKKEVEEIHNLFKDMNFTSTLLIGEEASEESIKSLSGNSPKILHFATHGYVISTLPQLENNPFVTSIRGLNEKDTYMLWSGLLLTGGNNTWIGEALPEGVEDGILTAEEISRLDLSNTELVVLSACDTGRGHIDPVEGVWGLQRAFKEAGVKTILMTLWKVPDNTTAMFMTEFYRNLIDGDSVRGAVKKAQKYLIENGSSDPYYWAPFVVLD